MPGPGWPEGKSAQGQKSSAHCSNPSLLGVTRKYSKNGGVVDGVPPGRFDSSWSEVSVAQSCLTLCKPVNCSLPGSTVHRILQARILECVTIFFSRRSSWPRDQSWVSCIAGRFFIIWAISLLWLKVVPYGFLSPEFNYCSLRPWAARAISLSDSEEMQGQGRAIHLGICQKTNLKCSPSDNLSVSLGFSWKSP